MNANLPPKMLAINTWLSEAAAELRRVGIDSAKLDAEIILAHTLRKSRTFLHAHSDELLQDRQLEVADARLRLRLDRTPIAYIIGHKEFYGRSFRVTTSTLIPRPESETIVTIVKELLPTNLALLQTPRLRLLDIGTGTGCIGISIKLESPEDIDVSLLDVSRHALKVAELNAKQLHADVEIILSDLLDHYPLIANIIVANLPYVDIEWERSPETNYEPDLALFAKDHGLYLINKLLIQALSHLTRSGHLLLEADPRQHQVITSNARNHGYTVCEIRDYIICLQKS